MTGIYKNRKTPGVYVTEFPAFPPSIVGVQTAVPAFIGYTERAGDPNSDQPLYLQAVPIKSMADFTSIFGNAFPVKFNIVSDNDCADHDFSILPGVFGSETTYFKLKQTATSTFHLHNSLRLFYANGGGSAYVVSVGNYAGKRDNTVGKPADAGTGINKDDLIKGLDVINDQIGPTMLVIPDACQLKGGDYQEVVGKQLSQCSTLGDRVAILDLQGVTDPANWKKDSVGTQTEKFYAAIAPHSAGFSYGAAYFPALKTSTVQASEVNYTNLNIFGTDSDAKSTAQYLACLLIWDAVEKYGSSPTQLRTVLSAVAGTMPDYLRLGSPAAGGAFSVHINAPTAVVGTIAVYLKSKTSAIDVKRYDEFGGNLPVGAPEPVPADQPAEVVRVNHFLTDALPLMAKIQSIIQTKMNVAPPSGAIAGVYSLNDQNRDVWNAPANQALTGVVAPTVVITDEEQGNLNVPLNGNAINAIRTFVNRGTLVWGARTLDGNSNDYRYIQVRRTLIYIEQSIKTALQPFVFAPNDDKTWVTVTSMITNFLTGLWTSGGLMGDKASDAFSVQCGLGSTMTAQDILDGYMIVSVTLQMIHPAEFIELTFKQTMQGA